MQQAPPSEELQAAAAAQEASGQLLARSAGLPWAEPVMSWGLQQGPEGLWLGLVQAAQAAGARLVQPAHEACLKSVMQKRVQCWPLPGAGSCQPCMGLPPTQKQER